jgi:hypothetical protein
MAEPDPGYISMLADALTEECKHKKAVRVFFDYIHHYYFVRKKLAANIQTLQNSNHNLARACIGSGEYPDFFQV